MSRRPHGLRPHRPHPRKARFAPAPGPASPTAALALAVVASVALAACGAQPEPAARAAGPAAPATAQFTENGVTVTLSVADWHAGDGTLTAVFTPEKKGFHLYSTDLPATGVEGVGRPTTVAVSGTLRARAGLTAAADVRTIRVPGVDAPVPVYPDGPVTTTLPVRAEGTGDATVLVGYASCSTEEGCTIPVADRPVRLRVTATGPAFVAP
ncbi:hypothetical protein [Streptomyces antimicrobicus]|uniref:Thiol:disulfide interchange protein DsbD N-terminal domain-containing protein n=1 Tax=Streptomyces antimicrobicus TaxID=2883108 RepID=A0ABS8BBC5_9ACTN|nr:hypothetical protein [Streptomyces antimicrobicus]MCB5181915.1 hypothetical protein [Streptomyces antimicrobicus]